MIDTHCHIIAGVDDGARDLAESVRMARMAASQGSRAIVATPHIVEGIYSGGDRHERLAELRQALEAEGVELELAAGAEVPMSMCLAGDAEVLGPLTLAGSRYLLMETAETTYDQLAMAIHRVRLCGLRPVLAHPERTRFVAQEPGRLSDLMRGGGVYAQITGASLEGVFGKSVKEASLKLVRMGLAHLVASDAHSTGRRSPALDAAWRALEKVAGADAASLLLRENPGRVLEDTPLESLPPGAAGSGGLIGRFFRR